MDLRPPVGLADHARGAAGAPLTLVEFGDYECPYCGEAQSIVKELAAEFGDKLRHVFRNYPLVDMHPDAMAAALVAEAAGEDRFWVLHDTIYANQDALDPTSLIGYAAEAGVSKTKALDALGGSTRVKVEADIASGNASGIEGTPTFYINGKRHSGDWSVQALSKALHDANRGH